MKYLLDTCVISDFVKGHPKVAATLLAHTPDELAVSTISLMEVEYGLQLDASRERSLRPKLATFYTTVHLLPFTREDASAAAKIRVALRRRGLPIGPYDILLAGTAIQNRLIFVTSNIGEFDRVPGLKLENWRE